MRGKEGLVRAYGAREIASGMLTLSVDKQAGRSAAWRVTGWISRHCFRHSHDNPKRENVGWLCDGGGHHVA